MGALQPRPLTLAERQRGLCVRAAVNQSAAAVADTRRGLVYELTLPGQDAEALLDSVRSLGLETPVVAVATSGGLARAHGAGATAVAEGGEAEADGTAATARASGLATARALGEFADATACGPHAFALAHGQRTRATARCEDASQCIAYARTEGSQSGAVAAGPGSRAAALSDRGLVAHTVAYDGAEVLGETGRGPVYLEGRGPQTRIFADNWSVEPARASFSDGARHVLRDRCHNRP